MIKNFDILKFIRIISVIIFSITLISCSGSGGEKNKNNEKSTLSDTPEEELEKAHDSCWQGDVIKFSYQVLGASTISIYKTISNESIPLMMIAFAVWFAFKMIIHVSSFTEENIGEFWKEVMSQFMLCFVCGFLASSSILMMTTLNLTVFPIYNAMLEFGSEMLQKTADSSSGKYEIQISDHQAAKEFTESLSCKPSDASKFMTEDSFPTAPQQMMSCMACAVNQRLNIGISIAYKALANFNIVSLLTGLFILGGFMIVKLGFVFSLVDSIFRLGIMVILLPILIVGYAFKATRKWTVQGFLIMLSSGSFMAFISIIISLVLVSMETLFKSNSPVFGSMLAEGFTEVTFQEFSAVFLCLILITFLLVQSIAIAKEISNKLVGGDADDKFAKKLKAIVQGVALFVIGLITAGTSTPVVKVLKKLVEKGVKKATEDQDKKI